MALQYSLTPAQVDDIPLAHVLLMLAGGLKKRANEMYLNARLMAQVWNTSGAEKAKQPKDYMPAGLWAIMLGDDADSFQEAYSRMETQWEKAQESDHIMRVREEMLRQAGQLPDYAPDVRARLMAAGKIPDVSGFKEMPIYTVD